MAVKRLCEKDIVQCLILRLFRTFDKKQIFTPAFHFIMLAGKFFDGSRVLFQLVRKFALGCNFGCVIGSALLQRLQFFGALALRENIVLVKKQHPPDKAKRCQ